MIATMSHDAFNAAAKDGSVKEKLQKILKETKPESVYFTELGGQRTAVMIVEMQKASDIPSLAEPWFLTFEADVEFHPAMTPEDLDAAGLDALGRKWA